jgi:hypothetical protein
LKLFALIVCVSTGVLASAGHPVQAGEQHKAPVVQIDSGRISGITDAGVMSYKGIPYAAPPVGDLRWRAPQPVPVWTGVRAANKVGPLCMQIVNTGDNGVGPPPDSEDCLNLDVYAPASGKRAKLPVMFWIHGGGYVNGSGTAALYDGSELAKQGVVVVSINYRLGRFGFFAHPALTKENPDGPLGNYAFMDQIAALQWVKRNIAVFGGNPDNVTIFGESAGGGAVINLMISPAAQGLFHKAISQSGVARVPFPYLNRTNEEGIPSAQEQGKAFASMLGVTTDDVTALRAIPAQRIIDAGDADFGRGGPMIDGKILTSRADVAFENHVESRVPFLLGSNALEFPPSPDSNVHFRELLRFPAPQGARLLAAYGTEDRRPQRGWSAEVAQLPACRRSTHQLQKRRSCGREDAELSGAGRHCRGLFQVAMSMLQGELVNRIFPTVRPSASNRWPSPAFAIGSTESITGTIFPASMRGHTFSRTAFTIAAFCSRGRARNIVALTLCRFDISRRNGNGGSSGEPLLPIMTRWPSRARHLRLRSR